jgi:hypothetical protein
MWKLRARAVGVAHIENACIGAFHGFSEVDNGLSYLLVCPIHHGRSAETMFAEISSVPRKSKDNSKTAEGGRVWTAPLATEDHIIPTRKLAHFKPLSSYKRIYSHLRSLKHLRINAGFLRWLHSQDRGHLPSNFNLYLEVSSATHSSEYVTPYFSANSGARVGLPASASSTKYFSNPAERSPPRAGLGPGRHSRSCASAPGA